MSNPNPPAPAPRWLVRFGFLALAGYAGLIGFYFSTVAAGSDSSGYLNSARLLAAGQLQTELRIPAELGPLGTGDLVQFTPLGFWPAFAGTAVHPTYPTGVPLHLALAGKLLGWTAGAVAFGLFASVGAVWLCYLVGRELGLDAWFAAAAAAMLALCPVFLFTSVQVLSDTLATTWCLAAVFAALRARRSRGWAAAAGAAFAMAVLVRPTNLVLAPAMLLFLGFDWRRLVAFGLGGVPAAVWLALYNRALYGGAFESGYGPIGEAFAAAYGWPTAKHFLKWLALMLPAVALVLPFFAVARREMRNRELLGLAAWSGAIITVYLFYEVSGQVWWCLRFILPAVPPLLLAGMLGAEAIVRRIEPTQAARFRAAVAIGLAVWAACLARYWSGQFFIMNTKAGEQTYFEACTEVQKRFPPGTLVLTLSFSGAAYFYTDFPVLRWDQLDPARFARIASAVQKAGRTVCAVEFNWEADKVLRERCPAEWVPVTTVKNVSVWRLAAVTPPTDAK